MFKKIIKKSNKKFKLQNTVYLECFMQNCVTLFLVSFTCQVLWAKYSSFNGSKKQHQNTECLIIKKRDLILSTWLPTGLNIQNEWTYFLSFFSHQDSILRPAYIWTHKIITNKIIYWLRKSSHFAIKTVHAINS